MKPTMLDELKKRLSGPVDFWVWQGLNDEAVKLRWISAGTYEQNRNVIHTGHAYDRPDLLIPVALSMMPEGWDWIIGRTNDGLTIYAQVGPDHEAFADYPAAALMLAILEARTK